MLKKIINQFLTVYYFAIARTIKFSRKVQMVLSSVFLSINGVLLYYDDPKRSKIINRLKKIRKEVKILLEINEAYNIYALMQSLVKVKGDIAEVGVFQGGSAKIICEAKGQKTLHLFDTFNGLPELSKKDEKDYFHEGEFSAELEGVKDYLKKYPKVNFYKGLFPQTAKPIKNKKFSFVNLDVDIYKSTLDSLVFFYPRMNRGGIILSHDYINAAGVKKAFDSFFKDKPEPIIELSGSQCIVVKI